MSDIRNLIFPMTAGDLVQSAVVVGVQKRGDGGEVQLHEVMEVQLIDEHHDPILHIVFKNKFTLERWETRLKPDTPVLVTNIRRS